MQEDLVLQIKAERKKSVLDTIYQFLDKHNDVTSGLKRIRVVGKTSNNTETIIDTGFIIKKEFVTVSQNTETGEYVSSEMFSAIKDLLTQFG